MKTLTSSPSTFPFMYHTGLPSIFQTKQAAHNFRVSADVPSIWNTLIPGSFEYFLLSSLNSNVNSKRPLTVPKWDGHQALTLLNMFLIAIINNWNDYDFCVCLLLFFSLLWQKLEAKIVSYFVLRMFILFFHSLSPVTSIFISSKN